MFSYRLDLCNYQIYMPIFLNVIRLKINFFLKFKLCCFPRVTYARLTRCSAIDLIYVPNLHTLAACNKNSKANVCHAIKIVVALNTKTHNLLNIFL